MSSKKLNVNYFGIFGSLAYCHILGDTNSRLDQITERMYLVGYNETLKLYAIFIAGARRFIVRLDVKFMEDKAYRRSIDYPTIDDQSEELVEAPRVEKQDKGK